MYITVLIAAAALAIVTAFNLRRRRSSANKPAAAAPDSVPSAQPWSHPLAFISGGKLFYQTPAQELRELQSPYVQSVMDRMERSRQLHGWKEGTSLAMSFTGQQRHNASQAVQIQATSAQFTDRGSVLYFLKDESFGGLFEYDLAGGTEKRLVHKQNLSLEDLRLSPDGKRLLCAQHARNGTASIAVMNADGSDYRELTGGDTVDTAPAWVPDQPHLVMYQSSGLARNPAGFVIATGPASIQMADSRKGTLTPVLEDPKQDFLQPRLGPDGSLYYIRRPYEGQRYPAKNIVLDTLLFPYRLLRALFHFLNFFSLMYTRKPLTTASGPALQADIKDILLKGKRFDAEQAIRSGNKLGGVPSLVPASWQLVRRTQKAEEQVLASHVASFDLAPDGAILFSNGYGVFALEDGEKPRVLLKEKLIGDVIAGAKGVDAAVVEAVAAETP